MTPGWERRALRGFAGQDVATALGEQSLTAAQLTALIAQESGDLTRDDQEGAIAGIAQMGPAGESEPEARPATARHRRRPSC
jgi:hypothetical protein